MITIGDKVMWTAPTAYVGPHKATVAISQGETAIVTAIKDDNVMLKTKHHYFGWTPISNVRIALS